MPLATTVVEIQSTAQRSNWSPDPQSGCSALDEFGDSARVVNDPMRRSRRSGGTCRVPAVCLADA